MILLPYIVCAIAFMAPATHHEKRYVVFTPAASYEAASRVDQHRKWAQQQDSDESIQPWSRLDGQQFQITLRWYERHEINSLAELATMPVAAGEAYIIYEHVASFDQATKQIDHHHHAWGQWTDSYQSAMPIYPMKDHDWERPPEDTKRIRWFKRFSGTNVKNLKEG
jgi:hypothetical protein